MLKTESAPAHADNLVRLDNVEKRYGKRRALSIKTFSINRGDYVLLLGANGSGKSTLLRLLAGITSPSSGEVDRAPLADKVIAYVPQGGGLYGDMTLRENLTVIPRIYGQKSSLSQSVSTFIQESGLEAFIDVRVGELSGGFRQLAAFSCAIASAPDVLLLDEPLSELDSLHAQQICDTVDRLCSTLMFLVISSHDAPDLSFLNRRVIVKNGTVE